MFDQELSHYYNTYNHIDTLKLDDTPLEVKNGKIMLVDKQIAESENVHIFSGDKSFNEMKTKLQELTKKFYALREKFDENPDDFEIYKSFSELASERASLMQSIKDVEKSKLEFIEEMYKNIEKGELSERQKEGYRLMQKGDIEGAKAVLAVDEIMLKVAEKEEQLEKVKNIEESIKDSLQINVNELLQRIEVLKSVAITIHSAEEIERIYEKVYNVVNKNGLSKEPLYEYAEFLYDQKNYMKSISIAEEFLEVCTDDYHRLRTLNILGTLYNNTQQMNKAETMYLRAIVIAQENIKTYEAELATSYNNLGYVYKDMNRMDKAEELFLEALRIRQHLAECNPNIYETDLAGTYSDLGNLYVNTQRMKEAEKMFLQALEIDEHLSEKVPDLYEPNLAKSYNNFGILYIHMQRMSDAQKAFLMVTEIRGRLAERNPEAYKPDLARIYYNTWSLYNIMQRIDEAERMYLQAIGIYKRLVKHNPSAYEPDLTASYYCYAILLSNKQACFESKKYFKKAYELARKYKDSNRVCAQIYENLK